VKISYYFALNALNVFNKKAYVVSKKWRKKIRFPFFVKRTKKFYLKINFLMNTLNYLFIYFFVNFVSI